MITFGFGHFLFASTRFVSEAAFAATHRILAMHYWDGCDSCSILTQTNELFEAIELCLSGVESDVHVMLEVNGAKETQNLGGNLRTEAFEDIEYRRVEDLVWLCLGDTCSSRKC